MKNILDKAVKCDTWFKKLTKILAFEEGVRRRPYDDANGKPIKAPIGKTTIGIGRNLEANPLSDDEIEFLLNHDMATALEDAWDIFGQQFKNFHSVRQMAIVAMIFQLGENGFLKFRKTIRYIIQENWTAAANECLDSEWAQEDSPARAERTSFMIKNAEYPLKYQNLFNTG